MAEAAVEDLRFYCHLCNKRFQSASSSFTCPFCSNGFIEEVTDHSGVTDGDGSDNDDWAVHIRDLLMPGPPFVDDRTGRSRSLDGARSGQRSRVAAPNFRPNIENFIHDVIINLGVGVNWGNTGNMQLFLGNPGDYAWGREGLDAIITQLLNQMDSTGPPPLCKHLIDSLPVVQIEEEQVRKKLQCSVCWEDFILNEDVRQLPCTHVYHECCIRPWLELHGTCPICRQNLGSNEQLNNEQPNDMQGPSGTSNSAEGMGRFEDISQGVYEVGDYRNDSTSSNISDDIDATRTRFSRD
ncbi:hypothetical protein HHI36_013577 [Cryptolaemus montrouzieri]|uniref:RING-type E3 ubiquitin transferase n=1 Tax=Cryptolaemus montrouzieri TaxID=559131 RepID=A0ABD2NI63_9CUCU